MTLKAQALKNVGWNWLGAAVNLIVGFFISPFILHRLGDEAFGIWVLIFSLTGYYGVFDFGIRSSIVKYVAEFQATGDRERLNKIINTAFLTYSGVAIVLFAVVGTGSLFLGSVFHFSPGGEHPDRALFLVVGFGAALGLPLSVFAGVLEGLQEFYALNATQAAASVLRAVLIVLALHHGMGLLTAALITVALPLLSYGMYAWKVMRAVPFQLGFRLLDGFTFRQMFRYSLLSFLSMVAFRLRFQTGRKAEIWTVPVEGGGEHPRLGKTEMFMQLPIDGPTPWPAWDKSSCRCPANLRRLATGSDSASCLCLGTRLARSPYSRSAQCWSCWGNPSSMCGSVRDTSRVT
jgi:O-antigen/teichoic acid export membrane protein